MAKKAYRVRNWKDYNKSLVCRGSVTFWFSEEMIRNKEKEEKNASHGNQKYSDMVILSGLTLRQRARHILVDSTGIQIIGEGEWKKLQHGESRHQVWRKLHIAIDADDQTILSARMTESVNLDGNYLPGLIDQISGPIDQITGDGAYDKKNCYEKAHERKAKPVFPPQHNARV